ncbi:hypothetical protein M422DRAFT_245182 [Sphaerobolus stellatus SS14]|nr:hypothetical protein M422DRAFT_245182 [Sphaerobolus stellatus SS14]
MSHHRGHRRAQAEELSAAEIEDSEPTTGLTAGDLSISPSPSVDPNRARECSPRSIQMIHMRLHMDHRLHPVGSSRLAEEADCPPGQSYPTESGFYHSHSGTLFPKGNNPSIRIA